jgi:hypothetical protein
MAHKLYNIKFLVACQLHSDWLQMTRFLVVFGKKNSTLNILLALMGRESLVDSRVGNFLLPTAYLAR